ncbi:hypothetical protein [Rhodoferax ferrireducens]|uniref:hypothetical protein n=1 Tax=Rhodoferax ferrireducens TaxID=192843 RepID=UPI003BB51B04
MLFPEKFLASFKDDPIGGTIKMIQTVRENIDTSGGDWLESDYQTYLEVYALINEVVAAKIKQHLFCKFRFWFCVVAQ